MFLGKVWNGGLERRSGSHVGSGPCSGPYKLTRSHNMLYMDVPPQNGGIGCDPLKPCLGPTKRNGEKGHLAGGPSCECVHASPASRISVPRPMHQVRCLEFSSKATVCSISKVQSSWHPRYSRFWTTSGCLHVDDIRSHHLESRYFGASMWSKSVRATLKPGKKHGLLVFAGES